MHQGFCKLGLACIFACCVRPAIAQIPQSIAFSPPAPTSSDLIVATLNEPYDCTAPPPTVTARSADSITLGSMFPNGIVNCAVIPFPPPTISSFDVSLGALAAGSYTITWNIYRNQEPNVPILLSSRSVALIVTQDGADGSTISPGFTGNWYNPAQSGHGFSVEVLPDNRMLAEWYVFAPGGEPAWIIATGPITGSSAVLQGYFPVGPGGRFPPDFDASALQNQPWGTLTFTFTDCNNGQVDWHPTAMGYTSGSMPITRLTMPAGLHCP